MLHGEDTAITMSNTYILSKEEQLARRAKCLEEVSKWHGDWANNSYIFIIGSLEEPFRKTVWASGPKIPQLESMINSYLRDVGIYLKENSLLISAPKSAVTLFTQDNHQFQTHPDITLEDTHLPLERSPKILGVIMDPSLSFHKHCNYVSDRIDKRNNMLKALSGSSWDRRRRLYCSLTTHWGKLS